MGGGGTSQRNSSFQAVGSDRVQRRESKNALFLRFSRKPLKILPQIKMQDL